MSLTRAPHRLLTPVKVTAAFKSLRTGRVEKWAAVSVGADGEPDGVWSYGREELPGTPWIVRHEPSGLEGWFGTLNAGREATGRPDALTCGLFTPQPQEDA